MTTAARPPGRRAWLAIAAVLLAAAAAGLAPAPSGAAPAEAAGRAAFAALASAAIVALAILPFILWRQASRPRMWMAVAAAALTLGIGSFYASTSAQRTCTAQYGEAPVVIGTELTSLGAAYREEHPGLSNSDLLFDAAGIPERIWTSASIGRCRTLISTTYFLWIPFLVVCVLTTTQAVPAAILSPVRWDAPAPAAAALAATAPMRYDVFISYRHHAIDSKFARELAAALETDGYRVAIDERDFAANASFLQEMERCVRESRFTVAVISSRYLESDNCQEEAIVCKVLDMGDRQRRLIPMVIGPVTMPAWLYGIVGIDCTKSDPLVEPLDKLKATLGLPLARSI